MSMETPKVRWGFPIELEDGSPCSLAQPVLPEHTIVSVHCPTKQTKLGIDNFFFYRDSGEPVSYFFNLPRVVNKRSVDNIRVRGTFRAVFQAYDVGWKKEKEAE